MLKYKNNEFYDKNFNSNELHGKTNIITLILLLYLILKLICLNYNL